MRRVLFCAAVLLQTAAASACDFPVEITVPEGKSFAMENIAMFPKLREVTISDVTSQPEGRLSARVEWLRVSDNRPLSGRAELTPGNATRFEAETFSISVDDWQRKGGATFRACVRLSS